MSANDQKNNFLLQDVAIIVLSIVIAIILMETGVLIKILSSASELKLLGSFVAGIFFTSVFTTAPAIVTLGEISQVNPLMMTAVLGAIGAVVGDIIIFRFIRDRFSEHLLELAKHQGLLKKTKALLRLRVFRWFTFFIGGLIIASPFPDELGVSLLGFSKMKTRWFIPISFTFNFIGILFIGLIARSL